MEVMTTKQPTYRDWTARITDKSTEVSALVKRMEADQGLYEGEEYTLTDQKDEEIKDVISVTLNEAQTFGHKLIANIVGAQQQLVVTGNENGKPMSEDRQAEIEQAYESIFEMADERLQLLEMSTLRDYLTEQICIRGKDVLRCTLRMDNETGEFIPDIMGFDARDVRYERDDRGLSWVAVPIIKSKDQAESEYAKYGVTNIRSKTVTVQDIWTREQEITFLGTQLINRPNNGEHGYGDVPFIIQRSAAGSNLSGKNAVKNKGESVYGLNRNLYNELNRAASILQTQNMSGLFPALQYRSQAGENAVLPEESPYGLKKVAAVEPGTGYGYDKIPTPDMLQCSRFVWSILQMMIQRGGLPAVEFGNLTFPLSAVAISKLADAKYSLYVPRLQALAITYKMLCRMIKAQFEALSLHTEITRAQRVAKIDHTTFRGNYTVGFTYNAVMPEQDIANWSVANATRGLISDDDIRTDIVKRKNPSLDARKLRMEDAYRESPILRKYLQMQALALEGRFDEARMMRSEIIAIIAAMKAQGQPTPELPGGKFPATQQLQEANLMPLLPSGGGAGVGKPKQNEALGDMQEVAGTEV